MAKKEQELTAAQIAARRPQAAEVKKRKDGSTYKVGVVYGRAAPTESPKPKTKPEAKVKPAKKTPKEKPVTKDAMKGYRRGDVIGVGVKASGNAGTGTGVKRSVTGEDGKTITTGKTVVGRVKQYAKGGMAKKGC